VNHQLSQCVTLGLLASPVHLPLQTLIIGISLDVPAGSDTADAPNIRAAVSAAVGALNQFSAGLGDTLVSGVM
jgi:hypothetical protein